MSFHLLIPVVPLYVTRIGVGEAAVGLILGTFAFSSMLWRPLAGWLADRHGRRPLVILGTAVFAVAALGYSVVGGLGAFLALRFFHGIGMGFGPTAASTVVADVAPAARRGEAMGVFGLTATTGLAFAPYAAIEIFERWGPHAVFALSAAVGLAALGLAWGIPETRPPELPAPPPFSLSGLFSRGALYPSLVLFTLFVSWGGVMSFVALFARETGLGNPGLFFTVFAATVLVARTQAGPLSDRFGRRLVIMPALLAAALALAVLARATSREDLVLAALLYGVGFGGGQPALMAMATDRVPPAERGRAMGTYFTLWELGISCGSVLLGLLVARAGYGAMWWTAAAVAGVGAAACLPELTRRRG